MGILKRALQEDRHHPKTLQRPHVHHAPARQSSGEGHEDKEGEERKTRLETLWGMQVGTAKRVVDHV